MIISGENSLQNVILVGKGERKYSVAWNELDNWSKGCWNHLFINSLSHGRESQYVF